MGKTNHLLLVDDSEIRRSPVEVGSLSHLYTGGFIRCRWFAGYLNQTPKPPQGESKYSTRHGLNVDPIKIGTTAVHRKNIDIEQRSISLPGSPWK